MLAVHNCNTLPSRYSLLSWLTEQTSARPVTTTGGLTRIVASNAHIPYCLQAGILPAWQPTRNVLASTGQTALDPMGSMSSECQWTSKTDTELLRKGNSCWPPMSCWTDSAAPETQIAFHLHYSSMSNTVLGVASLDNVTNNGNVWSHRQHTAHITTFKTPAGKYIKPISACCKWQSHWAWLCTKLTLATCYFWKVGGFCLNDICTSWKRTGQHIFSISKTANCKK